MKFSIKAFFNKCDQIRKMFKHTQKIRGLLADECLSVFDQFADLVTFTEEILNGKLHFLSIIKWQLYIWGKLKFDVIALVYIIAKYIRCWFSRTS